MKRPAEKRGNTRSGVAAAGDGVVGGGVGGVGNGGGGGCGEGRGKGAARCLPMPQSREWEMAAHIKREWRCFPPSVLDFVHKKIIPQI